MLPSPGDGVLRAWLIALLFGALADGVFGYVVAALWLVIALVESLAWAYYKGAKKAEA